MGFREIQRIARLKKTTEKGRVFWFVRVIVPYRSVPTTHLMGPFRWARALELAKKWEDLNGADTAQLEEHKTSIPITRPTCASRVQWHDAGAILP